MISELVGERNDFENESGKKRLVRILSKQEFRKSVGCIILAVTYGNKGSRILGKAREYENRKVKRKFKWILMIKYVY